MDKLISIIIPCYNVEKYIDRCFNSLLAQTIGFDKLEIIMIDDCSADCTWDRLTAIEASYPESVIVIHCDENGHQGRARNIGLQYASAPYVGYVDSDDWIEPDMYEKLYRKMVSYQCDIVMCQNWRDTAHCGQILPPKLTGAADRMFEIDTVEKRRIFIACGSIGYGAWDKLFTREFLLDNHIFFPEQLAYEDHFFATLLYFYAKRIYILEERLYHYYVNPASTVLSPNATHHFDMLTVDKMMWAECERRGFLTEYRKEVEYQFLTLCYLASMKMISLRLTHVPYDFFLELKEETLKRVPNYHDNPYISDYVTELNQILLRLLDLPINEQELNAFCDAVRMRYIKGTLQMYVMTHVPFDVPQDPIYHPLHVGRALKEDLGYAGDDTGDNISSLNPYYSELTGLYWVWKNVRNTEYVGLCHYRRYFMNEQDQVMSKADFMPILEKYDVIIARLTTAKQCYRDAYAEAHNIHDLDVVGEVIAQFYPDCMPIFEKVISENKSCNGNLFVTTKKLFDEYAQWLFSIFAVAEERIDVSTYDDYHKRVYGFLSEQLLYVWVLYRRLNYCEVPVGIIREKAETIILKEKLAELFHKREISQALLLFMDTVKTRPDVKLSASDFNKDLTAVEDILYICMTEKQQNCSSMLDYSTDLNELIRHYKKVTEILNACADGVISELDYLKKTKVSPCAIRAIISIIEKKDKNDEIFFVLQTNGIL